MRRRFCFSFPQNKLFSAELKIKINFGLLTFKVMDSSLMKPCIEFNFLNLKLEIIFFQINLFCTFMGSNSTYWVLRDARGPGTDTVCRTVRRVGEALHTLKDEFIR
jgi:hypothetical protein